MSLRIWLPLTKDLRNQGASSIKTNGTNVTKNIEGKIGFCYSLNGSNSYITLDSTPFSNTTEEFSFACWVKFNSTASCCLFSNRTAVDSNGITLFINNSGNILFDIGGNRRSKTYSFSTGTWYHIVFTYQKGDAKKIYVDGVEIDSSSTTTSMTGANVTKCFIGASQNSSTTVNANYLNGYLNDVRIYDHCLSPEEVRELANGLVLHYKLDASNENLLKDVPKAYVATNYCGYQLNLKQNLTAGQAYTLQLWDVLVEHSAKTAAQMNLSVYWGGGSVQLTRFSQSAFDETRDHYAYASYLSVTFTPTSTQASGSGATNAWLNLYNSVSNASGTRNMKIGAWKLEKGSEATPWISSDGNLTTIVDSSGYGHKTTIENDAIIVSNSGKYNGALQCDSTHYITIINNMIIEDNAPYAISCWFKSNDSNTSLQIYINGSTYTINDQSIDISGKATNGRRLMITDSWSDYHICDNQWHLCYSSFQNATLKTTIDNQLLPAVLKNESNPLISNQTDIQIGENFNGQISDVRIYATPLLDSEIKKLYNINMGMDNKNQIHTYEFNEFSLPSLSKTGILGGLLNEVNECSHISLQNNTNWLTNGAIER